MARALLSRGAVMVVWALATATVACAQQDSLAAAPEARRVLSLPNHRWIRQATSHADLYIRAGSKAEPLSATLSDAVERAIVADLDWLGEQSAGTRLRLFFVGSREEMRPLTGLTPAGWAVTAEGTAFFVATDTLPAALRHEIMHLLSWRVWGTPASSWLSEGLATLAAGHCGGYSVDEAAAALDREGKLVPLETLWHHFESFAEVGAMRYLQAASLIAYIDRNFGRRRLRAFWPIGALRNIQPRLGVDLPTLERQWRADVATHDAPASWATIFKATMARGCE